MSHFKQRKETNCLNCGTEVVGRYCHSCGQENIEPKENFWHLLTHFVYDITHFDGKFFSTVKALLLRPGFLTIEYMKGRRTAYLNPIKMYVFISAFFFIYIFSVASFKNTDDTIKVNSERDKGTHKPAQLRREIQREIAEMEEALKNEETARVLPKAKMEEKLTLYRMDLSRLNSKDSLQVDALSYVKDQNEAPFMGDYKSLAEYDSAQNALSPSKRDSWIERKFSIKAIELSEEYDKLGKREFIEKFVERLLHLLPKMLFISLPLMALLLKLLYIRRKRYYYVDHVIYTLHLYCALYIFLWVIMLLTRVSHVRYLHWTAYGTALVSLFSFWYIYKSMRKVYEQGRGRTLLKYVLMTMLSFVVLLLLLLFLILFTFISF